MNNQKCVGLFGWLFGHRMEHNFNESEKLNMSDMTLGKGNPIPVIEALKTIDSTYINSICRRCGMVVEKKDKRDMV